MDQFFLGIDAGGTKTEAVIANQNGEVIGKGRSSAANLHNLPLDLVYEHIGEAVIRAKETAKENGAVINPYDFKAICWGQAGLDILSDRQRLFAYIQQMPSYRRIFNSSRMFVCRDGFIGLKAGTSENWGICLIASTGSNCYGVDQSGNETTAGGWGYLLGDEGSAYYLGLQLLKQVVREYDGRQSVSSLTALVLRRLKLSTVPDLIEWIYRGQVPVQAIADLSQLFLEREVVETTLGKICLEQVASALAQAYEAVINKLSLPKTFPVVLVGGLYQLGTEFTTPVSEVVKKKTPEVKIIQATKTPAEAAVEFALQPDPYLISNWLIE